MVKIETINVNSGKRRWEFEETNKEESETAKELIIAIEDGIVMEVYTDIKTPIYIRVIDSDDLYDEERQDEYIQTQKTINENIENGKFINIFMD